MIGIALLIAAAGGSAGLARSPDELIDQLNDVCAYASDLDYAPDKPWNDQWPLYVGRMETRMDQLKIWDDGERREVCFLCRVYLNGESNGVKSVGKVFDRHKVKDTVEGSNPR